MDDLTRARQRDEQALAALLGRCAGSIRRAVEADLPRRHAGVLSAEDVLQQTFIDAFLGIDRFRGVDEDAFAAWVMSIARRNLIDAVRHLDAERRGGSRRRVSLSREHSCVDLVERLVTKTTVSRAESRREAAAALERALGSLPEAHREVVSGYDLGGRPMEEVARGLGRSPGAAYLLRLRAHAMLRRLLGGTSGFFSTSA
jgi:RNA polymerase sigma-70 factor (ECF subfamily)